MLVTISPSATNSFAPFYIAATSIALRRLVLSWSWRSAYTLFYVPLPLYLYLFLHTTTLQIHICVQKVTFAVIVHCPSRRPFIVYLGSDAHLSLWNSFHIEGRQLALQEGLEGRSHYEVFHVSNLIAFYALVVRNQCNALGCQIWIFHDCLDWCTPILRLSGGQLLRRWGDGPLLERSDVSIMLKYRSNVCVSCVATTLIPGDNGIYRLSAASHHIHISSITDTSTAAKKLIKIWGVIGARTSKTSNPKALRK